MAKTPFCAICRAICRATDLSRFDVQRLRSVLPMAQVVVGAGRDLSLYTGTDCPTSFARSPIQQRDRVAEVRVRQDTPKRHRRSVGHPHPHPGCPRAGTAFRRAVRVRGPQCRAARRPASGATARRKVTRDRAVGASPVGGQRRALGGRNRDRPHARPASWRAARPHRDRLLAPSGNAA